MRQLLRGFFELATEAKKKGDTPVGSLIANEYGKILSEASERNRSEDLFAHAEILVVREAVKRVQSKDLNGFSLFTTNEPCLLCSYAIRQTGVSKVIYANETPNIGGATSKYSILTANDIQNCGKPPQVFQYKASLLRIPKKSKMPFESSM